MLYSSNEHIKFLFTLLSHNVLFEDTIHLLEEILAAYIDTSFSLDQIPNFRDLLENFSILQLAHFCRLLSLALFETEDRKIMEDNHILRSVELLEIRKNRMRCPSSIAERNQAIIVETPGILAKLVQVVRVINFGPSMEEVNRHNIAAQSLITSELMSFHSSSWEQFDELERVSRSRSLRLKGLYVNTSGVLCHV